MDRDCIGDSLKFKRRTGVANRDTFSTVKSQLTNLISSQRAPFAISIHGNWGTGKTFLLKRWQVELENQKFKAIYFNGETIFAMIRSWR